MKRNLLFVLILCSFTALFSQDRSIVPWGDLSRTTGMDKPSQHTSMDDDFYVPNKYMIGYHENGKQKYIWSTGFIRSTIYENERIGTGPWQGNVTISPSSMNYDIIAKEVLKPYYKIADSCSVHIAAFYDLSGNFLKFELEIPAEVDIPVKAIEELDSRLQKESKLKLDYDPEKAKYVNFITLSTIPLLAPKLSVPLKTEYEKTDSNTYVIKYFESKMFKETRSRYKKFISNINNPYEGIGTGWWQGRIKILSASGHSDDIAKEVLAPYWKGSDWGGDLFVRSFYDLNGDLQYFELGIPTEENIPVKVIEELENRLKKESKLKLEYDPEKAKYVNYIKLP